MVTVRQFKEDGFEVDDLDICRAVRTLSHYPYIDISLTCSDAFLAIAAFVWRKNTGVQPVGDDCWVEVEQYNGAKQTTEAADVYWVDKKRPTDIKYWKPSLKHLEQQMNDNQETKTALEMSERDMCDAVESEWVNGDECVYVNDKETIYTYVGMHPHGDGHYIFNDEKGITYVANGCLYEPETPEQKAARERMESAYDLYVTFKDSNGITGYPDFDKWKETQPTHSWLAVVDKTGYHKQ